MKLHDRRRRDNVVERRVEDPEIVRRQADGTWRYVVDNSLGSAILDAMET